MGMERAYAQKTSVKHHQTGPDIEPPREEKERPAKKHLAMGPPDRHPEDTPYLEPARSRGLWRSLVDGLYPRRGEEPR